MRLSKIKLSGFKSFVNPTTLSFPSNLMGVVGPNGCGKSNIIDAIRWVLGESSAKTLRGDSMADVIFNGSSGRKPVGQASIELVFDNSDGTITGSYAGYSEVAMRRVVTRDGASQYFLNGGRCRRKDITNLLLGTGVGSHGYSIIEQGMISRLVEAKPEELRSFLEEAAGISKYKERRRETEHRIRHTRDNMERLQDLRDELEKQLGHLQRQAKAAERFKVLKAEERRTEAELLLLRLRSLDADLKRQREHLSEKQLGLDAAVTGHGEIETTIEKLRVELAERHDQFNEVQGAYYKVGASIARLEQSIQHRQSDVQRQSQELEQTDAQLAKVAGHISDDEVELQKLDQLLGRLSPELDAAQDRMQASEQALREAEQQAEAHRDRSESVLAAIAVTDRTVEVEGARLEHQREQIERIDSAHRDRLEELSSIDSQGLENELVALTGTEESQRTELAAAERKLESAIAELRSSRRQEADLAQELDGLREALQRDNGRLSSLEALQEAALGRLSQAAAEWLAREGRENLPRLAARLHVEAGWERAVEVVLSGYLNAIETEALETLASDFGELAQSGLAILESGPDAASTASSAIGLEALAVKVAEPAGALPLLAGIYAAPDLGTAVESRHRLGHGESIVTPEGVHVTRHALRTSASDNPEVGVIARSEEIEQLRASVGSLQTQIELRSEQLTSLRHRIEELETHRSDGQARLQVLQQSHADTRARLESRRARRDELRQRVMALESDLAALEDERHAVDRALQESRARLDGAVTEREAQRLTQERVQGERNAVVDTLNAARERAEQDRERVKQIAIMVESRRSSKESASAALERIQGQKKYLVERRAELADRIEALKAPLGEERASLETLLDERLNVEKTLAGARSAVEACEDQVRSAETQRTTAQQSINEAREGAESARMAVREVEVRAETVREQFVASGFEADTLQSELPEDASAPDWSEKLEAVGRKIQRLGPINLAAIDEFEEKSERKIYLDKQFTDLTEALETLEAAIKKIDGETRTRFRDTFNRANQGLSELFPRLFGGGQAYLELENDDLLSAGVTVMARPPGKRISTIHLMSGGEKALTAVALVFAIFKLNPAPFCLLDEVDAPLDDANVGRFSEIVREMSDTVQFILITHNKTTMEAMNQLAGVTMHEPGVSRLVAVDIDEAVQLAAM